MVLASNGAAGRLGSGPQAIHLDSILAVRTSHDYDETDVSTELGTPSTAHRQRIRAGLEVDILISDLEPEAGALLTGRWEVDHSAQTRGRVLEVERLGRSVIFFDGAKIWRTIEGDPFWRVNNVREAETADEEGTWRATLILREVAGFQTTFTSIDAELAASEQDAADGVVDKGQQSTETISPDLAATIPT